MESDQWESVRKPAEAHDLLIFSSCHSSQGSATLKEVDQVGYQAAGRGDEGVRTCNAFVALNAAVL